jgi:hypothetical protein
MLGRFLLHVRLWPNSRGLTIPSHTTTWWGSAAQSLLVTLPVTGDDDNHLLTLQDRPLVGSTLPQGLLSPALRSLFGVHSPYPPRGMPGSWARLTRDTEFPTREDHDDKPASLSTLPSAVIASFQWAQALSTLFYSRRHYRNGSPYH